MIGAEVLELSVKDLNPQNIRRAYTVSRKSWKQTKYQSDNAVADVEEDIEEEEENDEHDKQQLVEKNDSDDFEERDIDDPQYEREAPWNQYAWLEEMQLRIHGYIPFGQPIRRAHYISQLLYGRIYHQSILHLEVGLGGCYLSVDQLVMALTEKVKVSCTLIMGKREVS